MGAFLGIDIGTSSAKAVAIDQTGRTLASASAAYALSMPRPLWSEQDPHDWWRAAVGCIRELVGQLAPGAVAAVGLTGQMHGLVLLDRAGHVLRPAILWNDQRTAAECEAITREVGAQRVRELTGNPVLTGFTAPKIRWVRGNEPELLARTAHVLLPKDYVRYRLSGEFLGDVSDASGTSLFDVGRRQWSDEMLAAVDVPRGWLPEITESPVVSSRVSAAGAADTGLLEGTPIVAGAGDQAAQAVGAGVVRAGTVSATLGTSGVVFAATDAYRVDAGGRLHAFCHAVPGTWHLMGVTLAAGASLEWASRLLGGDAGSTDAPNVFERMLQRAAEAPPGSAGLLFLPYLSGERTPHADPHARGVLFGLTVGHGPGHVMRAVVEGVSFSLRDCLELMQAAGVLGGDPANAGAAASAARGIVGHGHAVATARNDAREAARDDAREATRDDAVKTMRRDVAEPPRDRGAIRLSGGGSRNALWQQILADVLRRAVVTVRGESGAAYGAALLAAVGGGAFADVGEAARRAVRLGERVAPDAGQHAYERFYGQYRALYPALRDRFAALAQALNE